MLMAAMGVLPEDQVWAAVAAAEAVAPSGWLPIRLRVLAIIADCMLGVVTEVLMVQWVGKESSGWSTI
jgi:hypothetical protein